MSLIGVELLREILATTILTGSLENERPVSLILISAPESGKTSVALEKSCNTVTDVTDITGRGLEQLIEKEKDTTHIIFNDLLVVTAHRENVTRYLLSMINAMTEEGIRRITMPDSDKKFDVGKRGIIGCCTLDWIRDRRTWLHKSGLASRILPFCYEYSENLVLKIKLQIVAGKSSEIQDDRQSIVIPKNKVVVAITPKQSTEIKDVSDIIARQLNERGIRRLKQLRRIAMSHALYRSQSNRKVAPDDIEFVRRLIPFSSYTEPHQLD